MPEIGFGDANILKHVGMVYKEIVSYKSLVSDSKVDANKEVEKDLQLKIWHQMQQLQKLAMTLTQFQLFDM